MTDRELLEQYLAHHPPAPSAAFAEIVRRHVSLVYSVARRHLADDHRAEDVCQNVFALLAQKAGKIPPSTPLAAWLHQVAHFTALAAVRDQSRRMHHEREAAMNSASRSPALHNDPAWPLIAGEIDEAVQRLDPPQRDAVILRFFAGKTYPEIATELGGGLTEEGVRKRVERALEVLRQSFTRRGLAVSAAALGTLLLANTSQAAPPTVAASIAATAVSAKAAGASAAMVKPTLATVATAAALAIALAAIWHFSAAAPEVPAVRAVPSVPTPSAPPTLLAAAPAASMPATLVTTAPASPVYQGWVHATYPAPAGANPAMATTTTIDTNTVTGAELYLSKSPKDTVISYDDPRMGESVDYHVSTDLIRIGLMSPDSREQLPENAKTLPITYAAVIDQLRPLLGHEPTGITHTTDQGLDRYDFTAPRAAAKNILQMQGNDAVSAELDVDAVPTTIWINPATHLVQRIAHASWASSKTTTTIYTYGGPDITSIYDGGAPKTAKIYDNRPTPDTLAVRDRIHARVTTPLPDGVSAILSESGNYASLQVYEQSKAHWIRREYIVRTDRPNTDTLYLPSDWTTSGAEEFFHHLAGAAAQNEYAGTETDVYYRDFTPTSAADTQPTTYPDGSSMISFTQSHSTGRGAKGEFMVLSPQYFLFEIHAPGQYGTGNHVSLITDPQRPGLVGIHNELRGLTPDSLRATNDFWIDPAHGDRLVQHVEESFEEASPPGQSALLASTGRSRTITDYSDYSTLPDGREFAARSATTDYRPTRRRGFAPVDSRSTFFHFFPGRTLPPLKTPDPSTRAPSGTASPTIAPPRDLP